jgi:hypothetical protein
MVFWVQIPEEKEKTAMTLKWMLHRITHRKRTYILLGLLLCRLCLRCEVPLVLGSLFLTAETLPTLSRICVILPSGRISPLLFGTAPALSTVRGILESALILLLCFLPLGKEVAP